MPRRSARLKAKSNEQSSSSSYSNDTTNVYEPYSLLPMEDGFYWKCSCATGSDRKKQILCDDCEQNWGHHECHKLPPMDKHTLSKYYHVCFICKGIKSDVDRYTMMSDDSSNENENEDEKLMEIEDGLKQTTTAPAPTPPQTTAETQLPSKEDTEEKKTDPDIGALPAGKSDQLMSHIYDSENVAGVYIVDEVDNRNIYLVYKTKKEFKFEIDYEFFRNDIVRLEFIKKKNAAKSQQFRTGATKKMLNVLFAPKHQKSMPQYGAYVDVCIV